MATKNYMINDKWLDLDEQNIVELQSVDGVLDSMKVNGSEVVTPSGKITITENGTDIDVAQYALADVNVEGGGGSSDFSTANVTIINNGSSDIEIVMPNIKSMLGGVEFISGMAEVYGEDTTVITAVLYKGELTTNIEDVATVTDSTGDYADGTITGDCTITIS